MKVGLALELSATSLHLLKHASANSIGSTLPREGSDRRGENDGEMHSYYYDVVFLAPDFVRST